MGLLAAAIAVPNRPDQPTATCHLIHLEDRPALCGYEWEGLVPVPGHPDWGEFHPDLRCGECEVAAGLEREEVDDQTYRFGLPEVPL